MEVEGMGVEEDMEAATLEGTEVEEDTEAVALEVDMAEDTREEEEAMYTEAAEEGEGGTEVVA